MNNESTNTTLPPNIANQVNSNQSQTPIMDPTSLLLDKTFGIYEKLGDITTRLDTVESNYHTHSQQISDINDIYEGNFIRKHFTASTIIGVLGIIFAIIGGAYTIERSFTSDFDNINTRILNLDKTMNVHISSLDKNMNRLIV